MSISKKGDLSVGSPLTLKEGSNKMIKMRYFMLCSYTVTKSNL